MSDQQPQRLRYERAKEVLQRALEVAPEERRSYVDAACGGDAELCAEVLSLLAAYDAADSRFLASPLSTLPDERPPAVEDADLTGRRVGAYRLERLLGRGGMGVVYLASRDDGEFTKHVAIKFIHPSKATPALLKRFRAERQILADIDHPNIARLIDGGTAEGGMPFFIMEYVPGETLSQILDRGPLPLPRAIRLATGVADVLAAIHARGMVFRDLKPSNVILTAESGVKVLDFGIAKIMRGDSGEETTTLTEPGWIIGSPRYMSPEQASGEHVDARSDIFSFGIVIFEALTGHLPFTGATRREYFKSLHTARPKRLPHSVPPGLRAVVDRCLQKSPDDRFESGAELAKALRIASGQTDDGRHRTDSRLRWAIVAILAVLVVALGVWVIRPPTPAGAVSLLKGPPKLIATWASNETKPRMSPDLRWVSFISDRDGAEKIWLVDRTTGAERAIAPPGGDVRTHEWSPSSDHIAYAAPLGARTSLVIMPIVDGKPRTFELPQSDAVLVRWIGEGIYYLADGSLWRFDLKAARPREVTTARGSLRLRSADVSADEKHIVFSAVMDTISSIFYAAMDGSGAARLTEERIDPKFLRWKSAAARDVVFVSEEGDMVDVWQLDVATRRRERLTVTDAREGGIDVSRNGEVLLYEQIREEAHLAVLDPSDNKPAVRQLTSDSLSDYLPGASSSGREVVFQRSTTFDAALGLSRATIRLGGDDFRGAAEKLENGYAPEISPDGRWVAYSVWKPPVAELWMIDVRERRPELVSETFVRFQYNTFPLARLGTNLTWSAQGPRLYFVARGPTGAPEIWQAEPPSAGQGMHVEPITNIGEENALITDLRVSSDGSRLSYLLRSDARAVSELHVVVLARKEDGVQFRQTAGFRLWCPGWTADDDAIVVLRSDPQMILADVLLVKAGQEKQVGRLKEATPGSPALDPLRRTLYFARTQGKVHGLFAFSLNTGQERQVFQGDIHGPAFSGIRVLGNGQLLFSLHAQNHDILSNEFGR